jgi:hypothetical protein
VKKYKSKVIKLTAKQWKKSGDLPLEIVGNFRLPPGDEDAVCTECGLGLLLHGYIEEENSEFLVCPNDYIVCIEGKHYPVKEDTFFDLYEEDL